MKQHHVCVNKMRFQFRILSNSTNCAYYGYSPKSHGRNNRILVLVEEMFLSTYEYLRDSKKN